MTAHFSYVPLVGYLFLLPHFAPTCFGCRVCFCPTLSEFPSTATRWEDLCKPFQSLRGLIRVLAIISVSQYITSILRQIFVPCERIRSLWKDCTYINSCVRRCWAKSAHSRLKMDKCCLCYLLTSLHNICTLRFCTSTPRGEMQPHLSASVPMQSVIRVSRTPYFF